MAVGAGFAAAASPPAGGSSEAPSPAARDHRCRRAGARPTSASARRPSPRRGRPSRCTPATARRPVPRSRAPPLRLQALARPPEAAVFVNGRPDIAAAVGAQGVQLGTGDLAPADARRVFPAGWIGRSVHQPEPRPAAPPRRAPTSSSWATSTRPRRTPAGPDGLGTGSRGGCARAAGDRDRRGQRGERAAELRERGRTAWRPSPRCGTPPTPRRPRWRSWRPGWRTHDRNGHRSERRAAPGARHPPRCWICWNARPRPANRGGRAEPGDRTPPPPRRDHLASGDAVELVHFVGGG